MNNVELNWDDLRFFLAAARASTLSGAARELNVGHVTVGRRLAALERSLGSILFNRTPQGLTLTAEGQAILQQCSDMETAAVNVGRIAAGRDSRVEGSVRLATTQALARAVLPALSRLRLDYPGLQIELEAGVRTLDISRREADLALRLVRPTTPNLVCRKVAEVGFALYASPAYLEAHGCPERGRGLAGHDLIGFTAMPEPIAPFFMAESLVGARFAMRCNDVFLQRTAASCGMGIAELACFLGDECSELVRLWPAEDVTRRAAWLIVHEDLRRSGRMKVISSSLADALHTQRSMLRSGSSAGLATN
jgi:DNA-binding transcriptional LysR family regulator